MVESINPMKWVHADTERVEHAVKAETRSGKPDSEGEELGGVIVLPPLTDTENPEAESYPADYTSYARERAGEYQQQTGENPLSNDAWKWKARAEE